MEEKVKRKTRFLKVVRPSARDAAGEDHPEWSGPGRGDHSWFLMVFFLAALALFAGLVCWPAFSAPLHLGELTFAPMKYAEFCLSNQAECKMFGPEVIELTSARKDELARINAQVNHGIVPEPNKRGLEGEVWHVWPWRGECHDYALTKRHELLKLGWPAGALLLAEVVVLRGNYRGEHHLVLVVRTNEGDFVLDSLYEEVVPRESLSYRWVRMQTPDDQRLWRVVNN